MLITKDNVIRFQNYLEGIFWPDDVECDSQSQPFYVFCNYPSTLKLSQIDDWINIQVRTQSPYIGASYYSFKSSSGVALWFFPDKKVGLHETALQASMPNGTYTLKGRINVYSQTWKDGEMISCHLLPLSSMTNDIELIPSGQSWAKPNKIMGIVRSPVFTSGAVMFALVCVLIWTATAHVTLSIQKTKLENDIAFKQEKLGSNLSKKEAYDRNIAVLQSLNSWRDEFGYLPQATAAVITSVLETNNWDAKEIQWQNRRLNIVISATELDITQLVSSLEEQGVFSQVSIRPNSIENSWNLELEVEK